MKNDMATMEVVHVVSNLYCANILCVYDGNNRCPIYKERLNAEGRCVLPCFLLSYDKHNLEHIHTIDDMVLAVKRVLSKVSAETVKKSIKSKTLHDEKSYGQMIEILILSGAIANTEIE